MDNLARHDVKANDPAARWRTNGDGLHEVRCRPVLRQVGLLQCLDCLRSKPPRRELPFQSLGLQFECPPLVFQLPDLPLRNDGAPAEILQAIKRLLGQASFGQCLEQIQLG